MTSDCKRYQWWQEKTVLKYEMLKSEWNDNIDHKNVTIVWISFADEVNTFLNSMHKRRRCYKTFDTSVYFEPYFWS